MQLRRVCSRVGGLGTRLIIAGQYIWLAHECFTTPGGKVNIVDHMGECVCGRRRKPAIVGRGGLRPVQHVRPPRVGVSYKHSRQWRY